jgi:hypothetical protein
VAPTGAAWPTAITELARQIDTGRVYDRDLRALAESLEKVPRADACVPAPAASATRYWSCPR